VHVAYVRGSVLLLHVDDRPYRVSAGRGDGSAQRSVIYDCRVFNFYLSCGRQTEMSICYVGLIEMRINVNLVS